MDAAYDAPLIKQHSESMGHVPLIDENPRTKARKAELNWSEKQNVTRATNCLRTPAITSAAR